MSRIRNYLCTILIATMLPMIARSQEADSCELSRSIEQF
jgi:hypothetical protein